MARSRKRSLRPQNLPLLKRKMMKIESQRNKMVKTKRNPKEKLKKAKSRRKSKRNLF